MQQSRVHCNLSIGHAVVCHRSPRGLLLRSEEHTSELQSQSNLVCRLLLEKKKNIPALAQPTLSPFRTPSARFLTPASCPAPRSLSLRTSPLPAPHLPHHSRPLRRCATLYL